MADFDRHKGMAEMSAGLAHELGQPISGIMMDIYVLQSRYKQLGIVDAVVNNTIQGMQQNVDRAKGIIKGIRRYMASEKPEVALVEMASVVENVIALMSLSDKNDKTIYHVSPDLNSIKVHANAVQLSQIFMNVFRNAIQAKVAGRPVRIEVSVHQQQNKICIFVDDDGQGSDIEQLPLIGQLNYTTKSDGMGVGLAVCKRIAEAHGGHLAVVPSPILRGCRIELHLPSVASTDTVCGDQA
jgi:signal transduction histidine kinase